MDKRGGKVSTCSFDKILPHNARKNRRGLFLGCHWFRVSKNFMLKGVISGFLVEFFWLAVPKHFVEENFYAVFQKIFGSQKVYG